MLTGHRSKLTVAPFKAAGEASLAVSKCSRKRERLYQVKQGHLYVCAAKRLSKEEAAAGEWAALLSNEEIVVDEQGGISAEHLNKVCNKGLKLMLQEDVRGLLDFQEELNKIGQAFSEKDNMQGALFIYVLFKMCDNTLVEQMTKLEGVYLEAFRKVFDILEDSGWRLQAEEEKDSEEGVEKPTSLDDLPALSYMQEI